MADVEFDDDALAELLTGEHGEVGRYLQKLANRVHRSAARKTPVDTGRLRSSLTTGLSRAGGDLVATVGTTVEYAAAVELGAHGTVTVRGHSRTYTKGHKAGTTETVRQYTRRQNTPAQPYLRPALHEVMARERAT